MVVVSSRTDIREFLATRRAKITPQQAGLSHYGQNRRVPGLRREEVALLAGVSVDYYVRLEKGNVAGVSDSSVEATVSRDTLELTAAVHPILFGEFSAFFHELGESFRQIGFRIRPVNKTMAEYLALQKTGDSDLNIGRWVADYPDADNFIHTLLHSDSGFLGRYVGSAELDALAERGRVETDPRVRQSVYRRAEELIAREALLLPLFHDQVYCFARPEVEGLESVTQGNPVVTYEELSIRR